MQPAEPGGHRHPALGAAHDHRHAGPVRQTQARAHIHELADLAQKFGTLSYPSNAAGFYFPVEIDPTYTAAPADFGAIWSKLPRLYVSVYYGAGVDDAAAAQWLDSFIPRT